MVLFLQFVCEKRQPKGQRRDAEERPDERGGNATSIDGRNGIVTFLPTVVCISLCWLLTGG